MCVAASEDILPKLPEPLRQTKGLEVIPGMQGMASVKEAITTAVGTDGFVEQPVHWQVVPKRVAATR
ncbi:hypothetical protein D9M69_732530 [compost metagenome]